MQFSREEISLARQFQAHGLLWEPAAGHFVYDETGFCKQESPFQDRVYFILNYPYFMKAVGGVDRFKEIMVWLPTWHDTRKILTSLGVANVEVAAELAQANAIESGNERLILYRLIRRRMKTQPTENGAGLHSGEHSINNGAVHPADPSATS